MESTSAIEQALEVAVASCDTLGCPPRLAAAIRYAVFPGGARIRPRLCLAIAAGCGEPHSPLAEATAVSFTAPIFSTIFAVLVLGEVVRLREKLRWFDNRPLFGKRVLVTRTRQRRLRRAQLPSIRIRRRRIRRGRRRGICSGCTRPGRGAARARRDAGGAATARPAGGGGRLRRDATGAVEIRRRRPARARRSCAVARRASRRPHLPSG